MDKEAKKELEGLIIGGLKEIHDPEIPVDVWELGLIYELHLDDDHNLKIVMTLTSPNCPVAESLPAEVENKLKLVAGIKSAGRVFHLIELSLRSKSVPPRLAQVNDAQRALISLRS